MTLGSRILLHTRLSKHFSGFGFKLRHSLQTRLQRGCDAEGETGRHVERLQSLSGLLFPAVRVNFSLATLVRHTHPMDRTSSNSHSVISSLSIIHNSTVCATTPREKTAARRSQKHSSQLRNEKVRTPALRLHWCVFLSA